MNLRLQTTCDTKTKTNKLQSVNPSVSCIVQHKKSTLTLNLLELWCKLKTKKRKGGCWKRLEWLPRSERGSSDHTNGRKPLKTSGNSRLPSCAIHWCDWRALPIAMVTGNWSRMSFFFPRSQGVRGRGDQAEHVRQRGVWLAHCKKGLLGTLASRPFSSLPSVPSVFWIFVL